MKPSKVLDMEYLELNKAVKDRKHKYHCFYIATINLKTPKLRTVVLRSVEKDKNTISFHTDLRSQKINDLRLNNNVSVLFYDEERKIQVRGQGKAIIEENSAELKNLWSTMRAESKLCYMGPFAPGEQLSHFQPNLPNHNAQNISEESDIKGYNNFCRVTVHLEKLDWLQLDHKGHKRILFCLKKGSQPTWIAS